MSGFRQIDARGIWAGDAQALRVFAECFTKDCGGRDEIFHRVYRWTPEALAQAKLRAFGPVTPSGKE